MPEHDSKLVPFATGRGNLGKIKNVTHPWKVLCDRLAKVATTPETWEEYQKLKPDAKNKLKNATGYFYPGHTVDGKRRLESIRERWIGSFDCDDLTDKQLEEIMIGTSVLSDYEYMAHTTRSHDPAGKKNKARIIFLFARAIHREEFVAVMRIFAHRFDHTMRAVDPVSFRWAQMYYWPTVSVDRLELFEHRKNSGDLVDPDEVLASWPSDWRDLSTLPTAPHEKDLREHAKRAERPNEKGGLVGAFCRTYDVEDAIARFELPYVPGDSYAGSKPRYTYAPGSGANGAVVEDGGLFLYSNHGTDPICDRLVNAFDLVRLHKFGALDKDVEDDVPMGKRPSWKAMMALASHDDDVMAEYEAERAPLIDKFEDLDVGTTAGQAASPKPDVGTTTSQDDDEDLIGDDEDLIGDDEDLIGDAGPPKREGPLAEMNRKHAVAQIGNDIVVLTFSDHGRVAYNSLTELNLLYKNRQLPAGRGNAIEPLSEWWAKHPARKTYHGGVVFRPGAADVPDAYNLWRGWAVEPNTWGSCDLYLSHIRENICRGDPALADYLLDYFADMIQNPGVKPGVAIVFKGRKGVGKDVVAVHLGRLFPQNYVKVNDTKHLVGTFNAHMERALLLHVEEGLWAGDHKGESALKSLITASIMPIERKGYDVIQMDSYLRLLITSNAEWVVPTTPDERRFAVFLVGDAHIQDRPYFRAMANQMENGGYGALLHFLMTRKITADIGEPPNTEGLGQQKLAGLKSVDEFWREILATGEFPCAMTADFNDKPHDWRIHGAEVFANDLHRAFEDWWLKRRGYGHGKLLDKREFGLALGAMTKEVRKKAQRGPREERRAAHIFDRLAACRKAFEGHIGSPIVWADEEDDDLIG